MAVALPQVDQEMTIDLKCLCGKRFRAKSEHAGKKMKCSACGQVLSIPRPTVPDGAVGLGDLAGFDQPTSAPTRFPSAGRQPPPSQRAKKNSVLPIVACSVGGGIVVMGLLSILVIALFRSSDVTVNDAIVRERTVSEATVSEAATMVAGESASPAMPASRHPVLPGAVTSLPSFLLADAPFDIAKHFESPPPEQNAAPLYLDALFEFSSDVGVCFTQQEQQLRLPIAKGRLERAYSIHIRRDQNESTVSAQELDAALEDLALGFEKLDAAQRRPQCVFETGLGLGTLSPHLHAARVVARWTDIKTQRDLERGQWDDAHHNIERLLRLSRDLRRRGASVSQLVSVAIDGQTYEGPVKRLLAAPDLTAEHCDRLLATLVQHQQQAIDPGAEAMRNDYVTTRTVLHDLQHRTGEFDPRFMKEEMEIDSIGDLIGGLSSMGQVLPSARIDAIVAKMTDDDYAREVAKVNDLYQSVVVLWDRPYRQRASGIEAVESGIRLEETPITYLLVGGTMAIEAFVHGEAQMHGMQCLIMLRRWKLDRPGEDPSDLESIVTAAGMIEVPRDPYGDGPLQMAQLRNETVIYSIGKDGKDHKAQADWNHGQQAGDFIFRMKRTP
jgi:hypothetical protein